MPREYSWRQLYSGARTYLRPVPAGGGVETISSAYCYTVWLRHLVTLATHGVPLPRRVVEFGPGRSVGVGIAALLSGVESYVGLDALPLRDHSQEPRLWQELRAMFAGRAPIPEDGFTNVQPAVADHAFPATLIQTRADVPEHAITYHAPWGDVAPTGDADLVLSQAVMMLLPDIRAGYRQAARWLRLGGVMSHAVNFTSCGLTPSWDGHRKVSALTWRLIQRRQPYYYNRQSLSDHTAALQAAGCEVIAVIGTEQRAVLVARKVR